MSLRLTIENATLIGTNIWSARLAGAEVRRLGEPRARGGLRSVISVTDARYVQEAQQLSFSPEHATVLNVGLADDALIIDIGSDASAEAKPVPTNDLIPKREPLGSGDATFLAECRRLLNPSLVKMITELLQEVRKHYPGKMVEGQARKWVNEPSNFVALTIQHRDESFAIHVKGSPKDFLAPTLDIRPDRGSYCRFKLQGAKQLQDAIKTILASASRNGAY
jgi:hypothetical protein